MERFEEGLKLLRSSDKWRYPTFLLLKYAQMIESLFNT